MLRRVYFIVPFYLCKFSFRMDILNAPDLLDRSKTIGCDIRSSFKQSFNSEIFFSCIDYLFKAKEQFV